ncbi:MAG TPA: hypothetical protein DEA59_00300 [Microbacterium sp.]|nr:hypothetical protein [Microbacterium sp.]
MSVFTALAHEGKWLFRNQRSVVLIAAMVLGVDVALGLIHVVVMVGWDAPNVLRVDMDGSYGEAYQYVKYLWVVVLLAMFAVARRSWSVAAWIPLFLYFFVDDAFMVHEVVGFVYAMQPWAFGIGPVGPQTFGVLAVSGVALLVFATPIVIAYLRADARTRLIHRTIALLVATLLVFAVLVDIVHSFFLDIRLIDRSLGFVEDSGEMVVLSLVVIYLVRINVDAKRLPAAAPEPIRRSRRTQPAFGAS